MGIIPVKHKLKLAAASNNRSQNWYFLCFINFRIAVIPFHNNAIENIINKIVKMSADSFSMPNNETGWILGSNSGKKYKQINGARTPIRIEEKRYILLILFMVFLFILF